MIADAFTRASEKLARACCDDRPGTAIDRWRAACLGGLFAALIGGGRDVTVIVGHKTDRRNGDFDVVMAEERS